MLFAICILRFNILTTNIHYLHLNKQFTAQSVKRVATEEWHVAMSSGVSIEAMSIVYEFYSVCTDRMFVYNFQLLSQLQPCSLFRISHATTITVVRMH
jgi:hypothetical protein